MFRLAGVTRLSAFGTNELLTNQYIIGQAGFLRTLTYLPAIIGSSIDFLGSFEVGKTFWHPNGPQPPNVVNTRSVMPDLSSPPEGIQQLWSEVARHSFRVRLQYGIRVLYHEIIKKRKFADPQFVRVAP